MRSLGTRRALQAAGAAVLATVALAGCSAGQVAETALERPSNQGVNRNNSNNTVAVRNLAVTYNGPEGYEANANAPLEVGLFNQTSQPITVQVTSSRPTDGTNIADVITASSVGIVGPAPSGQPSTEPSAPQAPTPSDSAEPSTPATPAEPAPRPAQIVLAPLGYATFLPRDAESLQLIGLSQKLTPGNSVYVTFQFSNGAQPLTLAAPVAVPTSPASRGPAVEGEDVEGQ